MVVPAFNESQVIAQTVSDLLEVFPNVVVVDDCSLDKTDAIAIEAGADVCRHPINLGQGAALQTGFDYALREGATYVVSFDADGQHSVSDAQLMISELKSSKVDVVLGSRFLDKAPVGMKSSKRVLLKAAIAYTNIMSGLKLTDTHNGLRAFTSQALGQIRIRHNRMAHASEILNEIGRKKLSYREVPCQITYTEYSLRKGQKMSGAFSIVLDLYLGRLYR